MKRAPILYISSLLVCSISSMAGTRAYVNFNNETSFSIQTKYIEQECMHKGKTGQFGDTIEAGTTKSSYFDSSGGGKVQFPPFTKKDCSGESSVHFSLYTGEDKDANGYDCRVEIGGGNSFLTCDPSGTPTFGLDKSTSSIELQGCSDSSSPCVLNLTKELK